MEGRTWADKSDIAEKRTVEEAVEKSLKDRNSEERDRKKTEEKILLSLDPPESKKNEPEERNKGRHSSSKSK